MISRLVVAIGLMSAMARGEDAPTSAVAEGNRDFACRLYRTLSTEPGNLFFSPFSISTAMAMTYAGARGDTAAQMREAMAFPESPEALPSVYGPLIAALDGIQREDGVVWRNAHALWPQADHPFLPSFIEAVRTSFGSDVFPVDYREPEAARIRINTWVEEQTRQRIRDLLSPGLLNPLTRLVLVNAVYFKGTWQTPFHPTATMERPFTLADSETVVVPTMYARLPARYGEAEGLQLLELPYRGGEAFMLIALPREPTGLPSVEERLTPASLAAWHDALASQEVVVYLPKFTVKSGFSLNHALASLGMQDAFDENAADFSGMDGRTNDLFISAVVHKAFVEVNEEGTEAAAATAAIMQARSMPKPAPEFKADRPFLYFIMDRATRSVLFAGRLADPR